MPGFFFFTFIFFSKEGNYTRMYTLDDVQAQAKQQHANLDAELSKYKIFRDLEEQTKIDKVYVFLGGLAILLILIIFNIAGELVTDAVACVYPIIASFKAIETPSTTDDRQWLTYWSIFGVVKMVEYFLNVLLYWVPYWFLIKTSFFLWLALPQFRGAELLHGQYTRNIRGRRGPKIDTLKAKVASLSKNKESTSPKTPKSSKSE
ncbi:TB2/DP1, HVA22 family-domain-containing protein [Umbelopsis sp. PMI_123]|nr:TB2/DP1, HVA22 family-domain-containing protein [Umbelopsis sp. PMI_123]